jgi:signal transduction histidine kinase
VTSLPAADLSPALAGLLEATAPVAPGVDGLSVLLGVFAKVAGAEYAALEAVDEAGVSLVVVTTHGAVTGTLQPSLFARSIIDTGAEREIDGSMAASFLPRVLIDGGMRFAFGIPITVQGKAVAAVWAASAAEFAAGTEHRHVARVAAERLGWEVERGRLYANLERAMAQILQSDERMLGRIGLDIHDGPTQHLSVALLEVQLLEAELNDVEAAGASLPGVLRPALGRIYETLGGALHEMRELIGHLRPAQFESRRLDEVVRDGLVAHESRTGNPVEAHIDGDFADEDVSLTQKITFYRILQEALNNAHRHGHARNVTVRLVQDPGGIQLEVTDDGAGFDPEAVQRPRPGVPQARYGLHGMRDRTQLLGGTFDVASRPGEGTTLRVYLPKWTPQDVSAGSAVRV